MALRSLGKVTVTSGGTPVRVTANETAPAARVAVQSLTVQPIATNTGNIYVGNASMDRTTLAGVYLIVPTTGYFSGSIPLSPAGLNAAEIYLDADTDGNAALVSAIEQ